jgi:hypothetical protein
VTVLAAIARPAEIVADGVAVPVAVDAPAEGDAAGAVGVLAAVAADEIGADAAARAAEGTKFFARINMDKNKRPRRTRVVAFDLCRLQNRRFASQAQ